MGELQLSWMKDTSVGVARLFNVYGENEPLGNAAHVIADLCQKAVRYPSEEFIVWGDGSQCRDFLYVSDCVDALLRLEQKASSPPVTVNVGSGVQTSVDTVASRIAMFSGKDIAMRYDPARPVGPLSRTADAARGRELLGWCPQVSLDDGLGRTYSWVEGRMAAGEAPARKSP